MSVQSVREFWQNANQSQGLQQKLDGIKGDPKDVAIAAVVRMAADSGFIFSAADYEAAVEEELAKQHAAGELNDEQLRQIAGGPAWTNTTAGG
jgi:predicted ribosomally synthesized peptide with nif11-like leader